MSSYAELIQQARQDPTQVDFHQLRAAYVQSDVYHPLQHFSQAKLQGNTNAATTFDDVEVYCKRFLENNPMDLEVWMMLEFCYDQLEQYDLAHHTHQFISRMLDAIYATGDGKSLETAWQVVARAEVFTVLSVMGIKPQHEEVIEQEGHYYAQVTGISRHQNDGGHQTFYFDITDAHRYFMNMIE